MKKYKHYGEEITYFTNTKSYEFVLEENNIEYESLPIISDDYRVLKYNNKYALCRVLNLPDDFCEEVVVFEKMPDDLDLDILLQDVHAQKNGGEPMEMCTKAKKLVSEAENYIKDKTYDSTDDESGIWGALSTVLCYDTKQIMKECAFYIQGKYGYTRTYMEKLLHYDIDEECWKELLSNMWD